MAAYFKIKKEPDQKKQIRWFIVKKAKIFGSYVKHF